MLSFPAYAAFIDTVNHPYSDSITYVQEEGIVSGYPDGTFKPDSPINRAEFAKIIVESRFASQHINSCLDEGGTLFSDIARSAWFAKYICKAKSFSIISGHPDGTFRPADNVNFAEAAKIVSKGLLLSQRFARPDDEWWSVYVDSLEIAGAIPDPQPRPEDLLTRAQMAYIIHQVQLDKSKIIPLQSGNTVQLLSSVAYAEYEEGVIGNGIGSVLFFHAAWCPYCIKNDQRLTDWFANPGPSFPIYSVHKIDFDDRTDLRQQFGVTSQDTFIEIDREGNEVRRLTFPSESSLHELLEMPPVSY